MNKTDESRLSMFDAVIAYCNSNTDAVATVAAFQTAFTDFETTVGEIHDTLKMQASVITGITTDKGQLKSTLCQQAADLSAIVYAYAASINNNQLKEQVSFTFWEFKRLSDEMLLPTCSNIYDALNDNIKALKTYGITADNLTDFQTAMDDFEAVLSSPRNAVSQRAAHGNSLSSLLKQANTILKSQMDKVAVKFKTTEEAFYVAYKQNRGIVGPGTSTAQIEGTVTNSVTNDALPGATVQLVGQPLATVTNENGFFNLKPVSPGSQSIKATIAGYTDKQQDDLLVKSGKTTSADIAIAPKA